MFELIYSSNDISKQDFDFVTTVGESFNIPSQEFNLLKSFIENDISVIPDDSNILVINNKEKGYDNKSKHVYCDTMSKQVRVLQITSVSMYVLKMYGDFDLNLNGQAISKERVHIFTPGSSIRSRKIKPIY